MKNTVIDKHANVLTGNDKDFCKRVWNTDIQIYMDRLDAIGFRNINNILDAGSGFGQWLYALSKLNISVTGVEYNQERVEFTKKVLSDFGVKNTNISQGSIEELGYEDNSFDAIFSFGVIFCTDYRKSLSEFYRVLKPGGKLYFNTNGLGWYLHNLINTHNDASNFSSREMAKTTIDNSLHYYTTGEFKRSEYAQVITPRQIVIKDLENLGFKNVLTAPEGTINLTNQNIKSFFKGEYEGYEGITEYLCTK